MTHPLVCQLVHGLPVGGAEVLTDRLVRRLSDRYRFVIACLDNVGEIGEALRSDGYTLRLLSRRPGLDFGCIRGLASFLREEGVDLVHAHQYTPFSYALLSRLLGLAKTPIVFTEHGRWHPDYPRRKRILFNQWTVRRQDRLFGVGEGVRQALIANEGLPNDRVKVIYNGIDLSPYREIPDDRAEVRTSLGLAPETVAVIQVARLDGLKDHLTAVRSIERLVAKGIDAKLLLVGEGPERTRIEAEIVQRGLQGIVQLLGLRRDVPRLLRAADIFLLTSVSEGIPLTVIEAMAAGLPVVSTDVGGLREVLGEPPIGRLAPAGDDAHLADSLLELALDVGVRKGLANVGRARAFATFSEDAMHRAYAEVYDEALRGRCLSAASAPAREAVQGGDASFSRKDGVWR